MTWNVNMMICEISDDKTCNVLRARISKASAKVRSDCIEKNMKQRKILDEDFVYKSYVIFVSRWCYKEQFVSYQVLKPVWLTMSLYSNYNYEWLSLFLRDTP